MDPTQHDPAEYGRNFADVYDRWYPGGDEEDAVAFVTANVPSGGRILELGVGTGRVGLALAGAGFIVTGLDSSAEMLAELESKDPAGSVERICADAGEPSTWPAEWSTERFDCVLAACNLLLNLSAPGAQQRCLMAVSEVLVPGGTFISERSRVAMPPELSSQRTISTASTGAPVVVRTEADPRTGIVRGQHIETVGDREVIRDWEIRVIDDGDFDRWCTEADLVQLSSQRGWTPEPEPDGTPTVVSVHRRAR